MAELPIVSGDQCISALERIGYGVARTKGSHVRMRCTGRRPVTVPRHHKMESYLMTPFGFLCTHH